MDLAEGTKCTPDGLTDDMGIEHDGSVNGEGGASNGDGLSDGVRGALGRYLALTIFVVWLDGCGMPW